MLFRIAREIGTGGLPIKLWSKGIPSSEITKWEVLFEIEDEKAAEK